MTNPSIASPKSSPGTPLPDQAEIARPFWSVMIPAYKAGEMLRETLQSILAQDPGAEQMQIEVVDDCSPCEGPAQMIREIAGDRVDFFRGETNLGLCGNWNRCIQRARGQWIHILHQDDLVLPGFYKNLRELIEGGPQAGAAFCRYAVIDEEGHWEAISPLERRTPGILEDALPHLFSTQRIQCPAIVVRREAYERLGGFNDSFPHALDWEMWVRIASAYPILYEPRFGACYRVHDQSMSAAQMRTGENIRDVANMVRYCSRYLPAGCAQSLSRQALRFYANRALDTAYGAIWRGEFKMALAQTRAALACDSSAMMLIRAAWIFLRSLQARGQFLLKKQR